MWRSGKHGRGVWMALALVIVGATVAACGGAEPPDVVGTWYSEGTGIYYRFNEDGTYAAALAEENFATGPGIEGEYRFEGMRIVLQHTTADAIDCDDAEGRYIVEELESGNIRFSEGDDECEWRTLTLQGHENNVVAPEYARLP